MTLPTRSIWREGLLQARCPALTTFFEELGVHHEDRPVPEKVLRSMVEKEKRAALKNATAAEESKKRKSAGRGKVISKRRRVATASTASSAGSDGDVEESKAEAAPPMAENVGGTEASAFGRGADLMASVLPIPGGVPTPKAPEDEPMPSVFGHASYSSSSKDGGEDVGDDAAADDEVTSKGRAVSAKARREVSEESSEDQVPHAKLPLASDEEVVGAAQSILRLGESSLSAFCSVYPFFVFKFLIILMLFPIGDLGSDLGKALHEGNVLPSTCDLARLGLDNTGGGIGGTGLPKQGGPSAPPQGGGEGSLSLPTLSCWIY